MIMKAGQWVRHQILIYAWAPAQRRASASLEHHNRMVHPSHACR